MLRLAICDDMPVFFKEIQTLLDQWNDCPCCFHIDTYTEADSLLKAHFTNPYDIILMDVKNAYLPEMAFFLNILSALNLIPIGLQHFYQSVKSPIFFC